MVPKNGEDIIVSVFVRRPTTERDSVVAVKLKDLHFVQLGAVGLLVTSHKEMDSTVNTTAKRVIIVGRGIAGPVLTLLLKLKGWEPVILEKVTRLRNQV